MDSAAAALVEVAPAEAGKFLRRAQSSERCAPRPVPCTICNVYYFSVSLPEIYLRHFSITCIISSGRLESKKSLLPVTG